MPSSQDAHIITFYIGVLFLAISVHLAIFIPGAYFYTPFTLGSWLVLDFVDYKINNTSMLAFFYNNKHRKAFFYLFLMSFFACFTVDFVWGVQTLKMWEWVGYSAVAFVRMYLIMNISFVLSMYELYRIMYSTLKPYVPEKHLFFIRIPNNRRIILYVGVLCVGILFLISPLYFLTFKAYALTDYAQLFPFLSIALITDAITYFTGGEPILEDLIRGNVVRVVSVLATVLVAFIVTEGLNLFGKEWRYLRVPFSWLQIYNVPVSVLIGWIPLVVGIICMVNMTKHLDYITTRRAHVFTRKEG